MASDAPWYEEGDRMLVPCRGGPNLSRAVFFPPPLEIEVDRGMYVLVDDGPPQDWFYEFVDERLM